MKKIILFSLLFIIFAAIVKFVPIVTVIDKYAIISIQKMFQGLPLWIPLLFDCKLYVLLIFVPILIGFIFFIQKRNFKNAVFICSIPVVTYILNKILKIIVHRVRPPFELQPVVHPDSFSFSSSHSLVCMCVYGLVIFYCYKYCKNKFLKIFVISLSLLIILSAGISRIWLGVHYPTDVIGAYMLGFILLMFYSKILSRGLDETSSDSNQL